MDDCDIFVQDIEDGLKQKQEQLLIIEGGAEDLDRSASYLLELANRAGSLFRNSKPEQKGGF